jgi:hypothetical protein
VILNPGTRVELLRNDIGGQAEQSYVSVIADTGALEVQTVTCPTFAASAQGDFIVLENVAGDSVGIWLDKDAAGTEPAGAIYVATDDKVEVDIVTGNTAAQVAAALVAALGATLADVTVVDNEDGTITLTQDLMGNVAAPVRSNTAEDGDGSFVVATTTAGAASNMQDDYLTLRTGADAAFYAWVNVNGEGVDPAPAGTGIEVALSAGDTASAVATALAAALDAETDFVASADGTRVKVVNAAVGTATDIGAGTSLFTVSKQVDGGPDRYSPDMNPGSISNNPAALSS